MVPIQWWARASVVHCRLAEVLYTQGGEENVRAALSSGLPPRLTTRALRAAINITADGSGWAEDGDTAEDFTENELAAKAAGQPCLCQHVPGSGIALLVLGVLLLCLSRIPPILNKEHHTMQFVRALARSCCRGTL